MDVFLIPVGPDRYELYCEVPDGNPSGQAPDHDRGVFRGLLQRFRHTLASFERERDADAGPRSTTLGARVAARLRRLIAEAVAEQRLLWHMRGLSSATAVHPSDLDASRVMPIVRARIQTDYDKHRFWLVVDAILLIASALLTLVPGPNLVAYYFAFRVVGHYLSIRGARQALGGVTWTMTPSAALTELRELARLEPVLRRPRLETIAAALALEHLPRFFDRVAAAGA